ncbi:MAG: hypothetical protein J0L52_11300 [Caulobacterales bacterium]|nr:hypothetical protein [Caulobacterales bacterium]
MKAILAVLAAVTMLIVQPTATLAQTGAMTRDELQTIFVNRFEQVAPDARITPTDDGLVVTFDDDREFRLFIDQALRRVNAGEPAAAVVDGIVETVLGAEAPTFDAARAFILIRPNAYLDVLPSQAADQQLVYRPLAGDLVLLLAQHQVDRFGFTTEAEITVGGLDANAVWDAALARTFTALGEPTLEAGGTGVWIMTARWDIGASLMLDDAVWARPQMSVIGGEVAVGVFRDALILVRTDNPAAVAGVRIFMASMQGDPNFQSELLFVRRNGAWRVFE